MACFTIFELEQSYFVRMAFSSSSYEAKALMRVTPNAISLFHWIGLTGRLYVLVRPSVSLSVPVASCDSPCDRAVKKMKAAAYGTVFVYFW